jgi:hypothetical protein
MYFIRFFALFLYLLFGLSLQANQQQAGSKRKRILVNKTLAAIYDVRGTELVLRSDLQPSLDGRQQSLRDVIIKKLMVLNALEFKPNISEEERENFLGQLCKSQEVSRTKLLNMIKNETGMDEDQIFKEIDQRLLVESAIEYRVKTNKKLITTKGDVEAYWEQHALKELATYTLTQTFITTDIINPTQIPELIASKEKESILSWGPPFTLKENEIAADKRFIISKEVGSLVDIEFVNNGVEVTKLIQKTPEKIAPLENHYNEVLGKLRQEHYFQALTEYQDSLLSKAHIIYFDPHSKALVESKVNEFIV